ncbi:MAG: peptidase U32 family protein [Acutalibacteraceae bacterium]
MKKYEILAPAGSIDDLKLMIQEGADAVYIGLKGYSSRPNNADFALEQIQQAVTLCHAAGVLLYVAINANVGQDQMELLIEQIFEIDRMGADAVILSEFGLIQYFSGKLKHARMHASTLMGVYNTQTVGLLKEMGVTRIIFYANLYFDEMAKIISAYPDLEYELVAEGGTCFNDIRQCRIAHGVHNGEHILFCRKPFVLQENAKTIGDAKPISEPPTRTAQIAGLFLAIGIYSFKIEGRTVPGKFRVPMVRALKENLEKYSSQEQPDAFLHFFSRGNRGLNG